jgi:hypothetical protein
MRPSVISVRERADDQGGRVTQCWYSSVNRLVSAVTFRHDTVLFRGWYDHRPGKPRSAVQYLVRGSARSTQRDKPIPARHDLRLAFVGVPRSESHRDRLLIVPGGSRESTHGRRRPIRRAWRL